jgi:hypothetical protein
MVLKNQKLINKKKSRKLIIRFYLNKNFLNYIMSRRNISKKRFPQPDAIYNSYLS